MKILFSIILKNEKLIEEISRIIKAFPHAVFIQSREESFTNEEFTAKIASINNNLLRLEEVPIKIQNGFESENSSWMINLKKFLKRQVKKLRDKEVVEQESVVVGEKDGHSGKWWNIKSMRVLWKGNPSFMHVFIDVTDIMKLQEANNNIKLQKIMFASASHEFRTPLNSIINSWKFVQGSIKEVEGIVGNRNISKENRNTFYQEWERAKKFLSIGINSSELLLALVEDVLNLSKIESNMFTINKNDFNISEMVEEVADLFRPQCVAKRLQLEINVSERLKNKKAYSDRWRLKQTLINLVANSVKFTFSGSITIQAKYVIQENEQMIEFTIADTGVGISQQDQSKLFTLFGMLDKTKSINPNGWGIGLTVSKKYIERLGGSIRVQSEVDVGTKMIFTIPYKKSPSDKNVEETKEYFNMNFTPKLQKPMTRSHAEDLQHLELFSTNELANEEMIQDRRIKSFCLKASHKLKW
jgi:signal transduction histidine kinase